MSGKTMTALIAGSAAFCLFAMGVLWSSGVKAQEATPNCAPRPEIVKNLHEKYKEKQIAFGLVSPTVVMELYASDSGTWTFLMVGTNGRACVAGYGEAFQHTDDPFKPGQGS